MTRKNDKGGYVSRGALKLYGAAETFGLVFRNKVVVDIGASTGGFTEFALNNGAKKVIAIDVGYGLLDYKLRKNPRVTVMERTNIKNVAELPEAAHMFLIDVSFISLKQILPVVRRLIGDNHGELVVLVKPQFEATHTEASKNKGVIKDPNIHARVVNEIKEAADGLGFQIKGEMESPITGGAGNKEFFLYLTR